MPILYGQKIQVYAKNYIHATIHIQKVNDESFKESFDQQIKFYEKLFETEFDPNYLNLVKETFCSQMNAGDCLQLEIRSRFSTIYYIKSLGSILFKETEDFNTLVCDLYDEPIYIHDGPFDKSKIYDQESIISHPRNNRGIYEYIFTNVQEKHIFFDFWVSNPEDSYDLLDEMLKALLEKVFNQHKMLTIVKSYTSSDPENFFRDVMVWYTQNYDEIQRSKENLLNTIRPIKFEL